MPDLPSELFAASIRDFKWESDEQRKGYLALVKYRMDQGDGIDHRVDRTAAFFIQKDHESNEWWLGLMADHMGRLEQRIAELEQRLEQGESPR